MNYPTFTEAWYFFDSCGYPYSDDMEELYFSKVYLNELEEYIQLAFLKETNLQKKDIYNLAVEIGLISESLQRIDQMHPELINYVEYINKIINAEKNALINDLKERGLSIA